MTKSHVGEVPLSSNLRARPVHVETAPITEVCMSTCDRLSVITSYIHGWVLDFRKGASR